MLIGQNVPRATPYTPPPAEQKIWDAPRAGWEGEARRSFNVKDALAIVRKIGIK
jgi:hypothetical protein